MLLTIIKRDILKTWLLITVAYMSIAGPAHATMIGAILRREGDELDTLFHHAKSKIDIRCSFVDDPTLLKALQQAGQRGVKVRIVVDTLTPSLIQVAAQSQGKIIVHVIGKSDQGQYLASSVTPQMVKTTQGEYKKFLRSLKKQARQFLLAAGPEGYAEIDRISSWYGMPCWSPAKWVNVSTLMIHTLNPDPTAGSLLFVQAWQHSSPFLPLAPAQALQRIRAGYTESVVPAAGRNHGAAISALGRTRYSKSPENPPQISL